MSMTINSNMNTNYVNGATGIEPQIIDVKTGEGTNRVGILVTVANVGEISDVEGELTPSQEADLEALLALLGLDGENAKEATMQTVLKAIQAAIKQQSISVTSCTTAISDYDVTRLEALKKAMQGSDDPNAQKIIDNVDRMMELKKEIEDLANNQGMTYDGKFEGVDPNPNFELNTRVREMGDRIADIRHYKGCMGGDKMDGLLNTLAPAMKTAVKDLLAAYERLGRAGEHHLFEDDGPDVLELRELHLLERPQVPAADQQGRAAADPQGNRRGAGAKCHRPADRREDGGEDGGDHRPAPEHRHPRPGLILQLGPALPTERRDPLGPRRFAFR